MAAVGSAHAARRVISAVRSILAVRSVLDVGCACGTWLREWQAQTVGDVIGLDGDYVDRSKLEIDLPCFIVHDLAAPFNLGRLFDLVQSLEVAEHLSSARAATFVEDLVAHAPAVLFSAATPGQGGENHLNEQPGAYWQALFLRHDFVGIDCLRPLLAGDTRIPSWYRYNLILYVARGNLERLDPFALQFQLIGEQQVTDCSPFGYRLRKRFVRCLPKVARDRIAKWNARRFPASFPSGADERS